MKMFVAMNVRAMEAAVCGTRGLLGLDPIKVPVSQKTLEAVAQEPHPSVWTAIKFWQAAIARLDTIVWI